LPRSAPRHARRLNAPAWTRPGPHNAALPMIVAKQQLPTADELARINDLLRRRAGEQRAAEEGIAGRRSSGS